MHEGIDVWQYQQGHDVIMEGLALHLGYGDPYHYELHSASNFSDYTIEQQATIVEDYYFLQDRQPDRATLRARRLSPRVRRGVPPARN